MIKILSGAWSWAHVNMPITASDGTFAIALPVGDYQMSLSANGGHVAESSVDTFTIGVDQTGILPRPDYVQAMQGVVRGHVSQTWQGLPVRNAEIFARPQDASDVSQNIFYLGSTDASGNYAIGVPAGDYVFEIAPYASGHIIDHYDLLAPDLSAGEKPLHVDAGGAVSFDMTCTTIPDVTPPTLQLFANNIDGHGVFPDGAVTWTVGMPFVSITADDPDTWGLMSSISYKVNDEPTQTVPVAAYAPGGDLIQLGEYGVGDWFFTYWATDYAGNVSPYHHWTLHIDHTPPVAPTQPDARWSGSDLHLEWGSSTSTDTESYVVLCSKLTTSFVDPWGLYGSDVTQIRVPASQTSLTQALPGVGPWHFGVYAMDLAGNRSSIAQFSSSTGAPVANLSTPPAGWVSGGATLTVQAAEGGTSDGVTAYWAADGGTAHLYLAPIGISEEGTTVVSCWAVDAAGDRGTTQTVQVLIDDTAPKTSDNHVLTYSGSAMIDLAPIDRLSGVAATNWTLDGSPGQGISVNTKAIGTHTLSYSSIDNAGNRESTHTVTFKVTKLTESTRTALSGASSITVSHTYKLTGSVSPAAPGSVKIALTRLVGGRWKSAGSVTVSMNGGKFSYSFRPKYKGRWVATASYLGQSTTSVTYLRSSATKALVVK
jgi:hypothetical protein